MMHYWHATQLHRLMRVRTGRQREGIARASTGQREGRKRSIALSIKPTHPNVAVVIWCVAWPGTGGKPRAQKRAALRAAPTQN